MDTPLKFWVFFGVGVFAVLAFDLFRKARQVTLREATFWSIMWITLSLGFNAVVWQWKGHERGLEFLTGYLIEYSLSVDNIFVFVLIFSYFKVNPEYQHRVLFWGVIGALVLRGVMIGVGVALVERFHWVLYLFGMFLVYTGIKLVYHKEEEHTNLENNALVRLCCRFLPVTRISEGARFLVKVDGRWMLTPLALVLIVVETTDVIFAVDSIPAIFGITLDPFIIYTSNVCAIMGLRSLYFLLAHVMNRFVYLQMGLALILCFIGIKMLVADVWKIPTSISLGLVGLILAVAILASMIVTRHRKP
jgi:tellurite resistance protein TerC